MPKCKQGGGKGAVIRVRNNFAIQISIKRLSKDKQVRNSMTLPWAPPRSPPSSASLPLPSSRPLAKLPAITLNICSWSGQALFTAIFASIAIFSLICVESPFYVALVWHISDTFAGRATLQQYFIWLHPTKQNTSRTNRKHCLSSSSCSPRLARVIKIQFLFLRASCKHKFQMQLTKNTKQAAEKKQQKQPQGEQKQQQRRHIKLKSSQGSLTFFFSIDFSYFP